MSTIAQDLRDIRYLKRCQLLGRCVTSECHIARRKDCLIINFTGAKVSLLEAYEVNELSRW